MSSFPQNFGLGTSPQVWLFSDFEGYNLLREVGYPTYLTLVQKARLERIRQARLLHDGRHWRLFLFEGRTQFNFPEVLANGKIKRMFVPYNLCKLIAQKSADLLFGDEPAVTVDEPIQEARLAALIERTALHALLSASALEASVDGEAFIEAVVQRGNVYLKRVDAADIFPEGLLQPDGQFSSYVKYNAQDTGNADKPDWKLLVTRYLPGRITRELRQLDEKGFLSPKVLTLNEWPQQDPQAEPLEPEEVTGLDRPSIVWIPNLLVRDIPVSDFDGLVELQDLLNAKNTQLARVLAQHSDPKMAAQAAAADSLGNLRSDANVFFFKSQEEIPRYITWNAELAAALEDRREARSAFLTLAEMSPILLGIKDGASWHNAFKSVRLEAINSITKAGRKGVIWKAAVRRLITMAQDMEQTIPGYRYDRKPVGVEMRDGLPTDTDVRATELKTLRDAGLLSVERGVTILLQDPAAIAKELSALADEVAATPDATPIDPASPAGLQMDSKQEEVTDDVEVAA